MRIYSILALMLLVGTPFAHAQSGHAANPPEPNRNYQLLRENEDWSFLRDANLRSDFWDPIKFIRFRLDRDDWYMSVGGEAREVWEQIGNDNWGQQPYMNAYLNERYMLYFDVHYSKHVRTFVELKSGLNSFRIGGPRPIDEKKLDFQAGFLEVGTSPGAKSLALRIGRQELEYGSGRLIDVREGPNVRLSFDGFTVKSQIDSWQIDGFAVRPDLDKPGFFSNAPNHGVAFWGAYATRLLPRKVFLDAYYLGLDRKQATFERGTAQEVRHSLGARISRPVATEGPGWDFDYEGLWQFGTFGQGTFGHGLWRPKQAIAFRRFGLNRGSVPRQTSPAETIQTRKLWERSIPFFRRGTTLAYWPPQAPVRSTSSTSIRIWKLYFRMT